MPRLLPEMIGCGRTRMAFRHGNYVIKVPLNEDGLHDNWRERDTWLKYGKGGDDVQYARCRLWGPLLIMQYARFPGPGTDETGYLPYDKGPAWAAYVDCNQVGYNRFGVVVAYDYGF